MQGYGCAGLMSGGSSPEGEDRPGYKSVVAVTYAATIVTARMTNTLEANHRCRPVPGPLLQREMALAVERIAVANIPVRR